MNAYNIKIKKNDAIYQTIIQKNQLIQQERVSYEEMKSCIRVKLVFFDTLTSVEIINELNPERLLSENIPQEITIEFILNKKDIFGFIEDVEQKLDINLFNFDFYEVKVKSNRLIYYKRRINFECLIGFDEKIIDIEYGSLFVLIPKDSTLNLPFFNEFQNENVNL